MLLGFAQAVDVRQLQRGAHDRHVFEAMADGGVHPGVNLERHGVDAVVLQAQPKGCVRGRSAPAMDSNRVVLQKFLGSKRDSRELAPEAVGNEDEDAELTGSKNASAPLLVTRLCERWTSRTAPSWHWISRAICTTLIVSNGGREVAQKKEGIVVNW